MKKRLTLTALFIVALTLYAFPMPASADDPGAAKALDFDGSNDYVDMGNPISLQMTNDFTVEAWIKLDSTQADFYDPITHDHTANAGWVWQGNSTTLVALFGNGSNPCDGVSWSVDLRDNTWHHLVAVKSSTSGVQLYLDGATDNNDTDITYAVSLTGGNLNIGRDDYPGRHAKGSIDEVRIWNVARTQTQIRNDMNKKITSSHSQWANLKGYWRFDEGSGTTAYDQTANDNDGTLTNMDAADWVTSTAAIGDKSNVGTGTSNLSENADVPVDITWDSNAGSSAVFSAIQVDEAPAVTTGLLGNSPATYWEVWMGNDDGSYQADVTFHYDNIGGIGNEATIYLYTRSAAGGSWSAVSSYTRNNEGNNTDGTGSITADNLTGFSQFIITSSDPVNPVPELPTIVLMSIGLAGLAAFLLWRRRSGLNTGSV